MLEWRPAKQGGLENPADSIINLKIYNSIIIL
jgi:hypothetical protein